MTRGPDKVSPVSEDTDYNLHFPKSSKSLKTNGIVNLRGGNGEACFALLELLEVSAG